ncbi:MAG TPA: ABC transporter permease [Anaerolineales bacterium]|nr:ABC transporter permease [Anaerolineales bacterium]
MRRFWQVAVHEFWRHVIRRRFLFALLSVPGVAVVIALLIFLLVRTESDPRPLGYVDQSGLLADPLPGPATGRAAQLIAFSGEVQASQALERGQIQSYFVLEKDYLQTRKARLVAQVAPKEAAERQFAAFLRANLLAGKPQAVSRRLIAGDTLVVRSPDGSRQMGEDDWVNTFVPFMAGFAFMVALFTTSGYLMQAVVEEKENRTIELLVTTVSPLQLVGGKTLGILGVGLTQLLAWSGLAGLGLWIGRAQAPWLAGIHFDPQLLGIALASFTPAFVMVCALMVAIGATVAEAQEGQQIASLLTLPVAIPYWFTYSIISNPQGPLATGLSFFPLMAPVTLTMRSGFTGLPFEQLALSLMVQSLFALGALWLAARAFRLGMLRYGQRLPLGALFGGAKFLAGTRRGKR